MKTTDLIPIILYQLVNGDRYGYEIIKQIEDSSNGRIVIKQPTLYSVLKKLEQGRFISSYWQDSEIGGKRHYYKLTDNGKSQLDTYPAFDILLKDILEENEFDNLPNTNNTTQPIQENNDYTLSNNDTSITTTPIDIITPVQNEENNLIADIDKTDNIECKIPNVDVEVEIEHPNPINIDNNSSNDLDINIFDAIDYSNNNTQNLDKINAVEPVSDSNIDIEQIKLEPITINPITLNDINKPITKNESSTKLNVKTDKTVFTNVSNKLNNLEESPTIPKIDEVKFIDYIDFSIDNTTIKRKKSIGNRIKKMALTCFSLLITFIFTIIACNKYSFSKLYYIFAIISTIIIIFYPILILSNIPKIRLKYCDKPFSYSVLKDFIIKLSLTLLLVIITVIYNLSISTSLSALFNLNNFANFIAPILFSLIIMLDFVYCMILYRDYK